MYTSHSIFLLNFCCDDCTLCNNLIIMVFSVWGECTRRKLSHWHFCFSWSQRRRWKQFWRESYRYLNNLEIKRNSKTGAFNSGVGRESREITLKNARKKIQALAQQLRLRPDHIDMVCRRQHWYVNVDQYLFFLWPMALLLWDGFCSGILLLQAGLGKASDQRAQEYPCHSSMRLHHMQVAVVVCNQLLFKRPTFTLSCFPGLRVHHTCWLTSVISSKWTCMSWGGLTFGYPRYLRLLTISTFYTLYSILPGSLH